MAYQESSQKAELTKEQKTREQMVKGSAWMTAGSFISRILGAIYIIPWYAMMGENNVIANNLFTKGYNIYALFLMISTAGIPSAIAKQISHYNSLNEYKVSKRLFKQSMLFMALMGIVFAGIMFLAAPLLAAGNKDLIPTMRSLSLAVLIFPCVSVIRGFFQGYHDMMPHAVSQIIEQIVRVFYMLLATFIIMKTGSGDYVKAVTQSTLAAFIGMLAALAALIWYYNKQKSVFEELEANSNDDLEFSASKLIKDIIIEAIPFIIVGSGITLFKLVDQYTFEKIMSYVTDYSTRQISSLFTIFSGNPDKLTMIVISLATALAAAGLPLISEAFTLGNRKNLAQLVSDNFQLFFFVMLPATFGMIVLAFPLNTVFYEPDKLGSSVLIEACLSGIAAGLFMLVSTTLQGINEHEDAVRYLLFGLIVKILLQFPCIWLLEVYGPLLATTIGLAVTCFFTIRAIHQLTRFNMSLTLRRILLIFCMSLIMALVAWLTKSFLYLFLSPSSKLTAFVIVALVALVGGSVYAYIALKIRLADRLLGRKMNKLRQKFRIS